MDDADKIINNERERSRAKLDKAKRLIQPFGLIVLVLLFGSGILLAFDMFSLLNNTARIGFLALLSLGLLAIYWLRNKLPKTRLTSTIVMSASTLVIGYLLFTIASLLSPEIKEQLEIDRCLDSGGAYNYQKNICSILDDGFTDSIKFTSSYNQLKFIEELKQQNIPFKLDEGGSILYKPKHQTVVEVISKSVHVKNSSNAMQVFDRGYEEIVKSALDAKDIPFRLELRNDERWLKWDEADERAVKETLDDIRKNYRRVIE